MLLESPAVAVVSRLVITGGNHHRLHEELTIAGGYLGDKSFRREDGVNKLQQWFEQAKPLTTEFSLLDAFRMRFERAKNSILQSVEARSKDRLQYLTNTLQTRKERELSDINNILNELEITIKTELAKINNLCSFHCFQKMNALKSSVIMQRWKPASLAFPLSVNRKYKQLNFAIPTLMIAHSLSPSFFSSQNLLFKEAQHEFN